MLTKNFLKKNFLNQYLKICKFSFSQKLSLTSLYTKNRSWILGGPDLGMNLGYASYEKIYEVLQFLYIKNEASVNFQKKAFWVILDLQIFRYLPKLKIFQKIFGVHQRGGLEISA